MASDALTLLILLLLLPGAKTKVGKSDMSHLSTLWKPVPPDDVFRWSHLLPNSCVTSSCSVRDSGGSLAGGGVYSHTLQKLLCSLQRCTVPTQVTEDSFPFSISGEFKKYKV